MLPPPPPLATSRIRTLLFSPITVAGFIFIAFFAKLLTLTQPCAPYIANPWVSYPLMFLAALDLAIFGVGFGQRRTWVAVRLSLVGLAVHIVVAWTAMKMGRLCPRNGEMDWGEHLNVSTDT